jgi:hypothetical protein
MRISVDLHLLGVTDPGRARGERAHCPRTLRKTELLPWKVIASREQINSNQEQVSNHENDAAEIDPTSFGADDFAGLV